MRLAYVEVGDELDEVVGAIERFGRGQVLQYEKGWDMCRFRDRRASKFVWGYPGARGVERLLLCQWDQSQKGVRASPSHVTRC